MWSIDRVHLFKSLLESVVKTPWSQVFNLLLVEHTKHKQLFNHINLIPFKSYEGSLRHVLINFPKTCKLNVRANYRLLFSPIILYHFTISKLDFSYGINSTKKRCFHHLGINVLCEVWLIRTWISKCGSWRPLLWWFIIILKSMLIGTQMFVFLDDRKCQKTS